MDDVRAVAGISGRTDVGWPRLDADGREQAMIEVP
jgi:hypothetical protein